MIAQSNARGIRKERNHSHVQGESYPNIYTVCLGAWETLILTAGLDKNLQSWEMRYSLKLLKNLDHEYGLQETAETLTTSPKRTAFESKMPSLIIIISSPRSKNWCGHMSRF